MREARGAQDTVREARGAQDTVREAGGAPDTVREAGGAPDTVREARGAPDRVRAPLLPPRYHRRRWGLSVGSRKFAIHIWCNVALITIW